MNENSQQFDIDLYSLEFLAKRAQQNDLEKESVDFDAVSFKLHRMPTDSWQCINKLDKVFWERGNGTQKSWFTPMLK